MKWESHKERSSVRAVGSIFSFGSHNSSIIFSCSHLPRNSLQRWRFYTLHWAGELCWRQWNIFTGPSEPRRSKDKSYL